MLHYFEKVSDFKKYTIVIVMDIFYNNFCIIILEYLHLFNFTY